MAAVVILLTVWAHLNLSPKPTIAAMPLCGSMIKRQVVCKHKVQVLAISGDDKTKLSYIIVASTVVMFTKCDFSDSNSVPRSARAFACAAFQQFLSAALNEVTGIPGHHGQHHVRSNKEANIQMSMVGKSCEILNRGCRADGGEI